MTTVIHDLSEAEWKELADSFADAVVISDNGTIKKCIGCFGCWIKTPGRCVIADAYQNMGEILGKTEQLVIISRLRFGSYSSFVKNVIDRSISYILPFFEIRNGEMHHRPRYQNCMEITALFYGEDATKPERETVRRLVEANSVNLNGSVKKVVFVENQACLKGELQHDWNA